MKKHLLDAALSSFASLTAEAGPPKFLSHQEMTEQSNGDVCKGLLAREMNSSLLERSQRGDSHSDDMEASVKDDCFCPF